jgi:hypothetical protein
MRTNSWSQIDLQQNFDEVPSIRKNFSLDFLDADTLVLFGGKDFKVGVC